MSAPHPDNIAAPGHSAGSLFPLPFNAKFLDVVQLAQMERSCKVLAMASSQTDVRWFKTGHPAFF